jgi:hypothetical protein
MRRPIFFNLEGTQRAAIHAGLIRNDSVNPVEFGGLSAYFWFMCRRFFLSILCCLLAAAFPAAAATGRIIKVLPQFLNLKGQNSLSPSLYDRDAYQVYLRQHPEKRSSMRFAIQWKANGAVFAPLKLRVELRGTAKGDVPSQIVLEKNVESGGWFSHWTWLPLTGEDYWKFGDVTAWRATLWEGDQLLSEEKSFLW